MKQRLFIAFGLVLLGLLTLLRAADPLPVSAARDQYFDYLQRLMPRAIVDLPIRVVDIDEASLAALGQWPWPRDRLADLVVGLWDYGAAVVAFDVLFSEPDRMSPAAVAAELARRGAGDDVAALEGLAAIDNDRAFAEAARGRNVVFGTALVAVGAGAAPVPKSGFVEIGDAPSAGVPRARHTTPILPELQDAAAGIALINVSPGSDASVVRRVPLVWRTEAGLMPTLSVEALRVALGLSTPLLVGVDGVPGAASEVRVGEFVLPTTEAGEVWVRYTPNDPALYIPAHAVIEGGLDAGSAAALDGAIVFVGTSAAGLLDIRTSALGESIPGVSIHAQILQQALTGDFLTRTPAVEAAEILVFVAVGLLMLGLLAGFGPAVALGCGALAGGAILGASAYGFREQGLLLDAVFPLAGGLVYFSGLVSYRFVVADREKRIIRRSFSHYVSPDVLREIEDQGHNLKLGGTDRIASVMFSDMRGFTALSESMDAAELVATMNNLFTVLGDEILRERGTIDKFVGDAIMAFWNAPLDQPDHAGRAMRSALGMRRALRQLNRASARAPISMATGIASGPVLVGNIGSRDRFNYSAIGDTVNRAARIEAACRHVAYDILVSAETAAKAPGFACLDAGALALKGVSEPLPVCIVAGDESVAETEAFRDLRGHHADLVGALGAGRGDVEKAIRACRALVPAVDPGLAGFYARIVERTPDFRGQAPVAAAVGV